MKVWWKCDERSVLCNLSACYYKNFVFVNLVPLQARLAQFCRTSYVPSLNKLTICQPWWAEPCGQINRHDQCGQRVADICLKVVTTNTLKKCLSRRSRSQADYYKKPRAHRAAKPIQLHYLEQTRVSVPIQQRIVGSRYRRKRGQSKIQASHGHRWALSQ